VSSACPTREVSSGFKFGQVLDALEAGTVPVFRIFKLRSLKNIMGKLPWILTSQPEEYKWSNLEDGLRSRGNALGTISYGAVVGLGWAVQFLGNVEFRCSGPASSLEKR